MSKGHEKPTLFLQERTKIHLCSGHMKQMHDNACLTGILLAAFRLDMLLLGPTMAAR
jgi:hypothetical protein